MGFPATLEHQGQMLRPPAMLWGSLYPDLMSVLFVVSGSCRKLLALPLLLGAAAECGCCCWVWQLLLGVAAAAGCGSCCWVWLLLPSVSAAAGCGCCCWRCRGTCLLGSIQHTRHEVAVVT
jgi:hypothetical protein